MAELTVPHRAGVSTPENFLPIWAPPGSQRLRVSVGCASGSANGKLNEDFYGVAQPPGLPFFSSRFSNGTTS